MDVSLRLQDGHHHNGLLPFAAIRTFVLDIHHQQTHDCDLQKMSVDTKVKIAKLVQHSVLPDKAITIAFDLNVSGSP